MTAAPQSIRVTTPDELELHASVWPNPGKPTCVLLHGFGHECRIWDPLAQALHGDFAIVALDFRGHGRSHWDDTRRYCHNALLQDLCALVGHLQLDQFHLLGHSLGARVAMLYTAANPGRVLSLTIMDTGPEVGDKGANRIRDDAHSMPPLFADKPAYFDWLCQRYPLATRASLVHMAEHGLRPKGSGWQPSTDPEFARSLWQQDGGEPGDLRHPLTEELWDSLDRITCETLVLRGQISSILKADVARHMAEERLAQGRLESVPMAGHGILLDNPGYCIEAVATFLAAGYAGRDYQSTG